MEENIFNDELVVKYFKYHNPEALVTYDQLPIHVQHKWRSACLARCLEKNIKLDKKGNIEKVL